jgi:hypothetical protein
MPSLTLLDSSPRPLVPTTRRCWRCLGTFEVESVAFDRLDGWWLCRACDGVILPGKAAWS